jgi:hypothetical protein
MKRTSNQSEKSIIRIKGLTQILGI